MQKILAVPLLSLLLLFISACSEDRIVHITESIEAIEEEYAPDSRVAIYDINLSSMREGLILKGRTTEAEAVEELMQRLDSMGYQVDNQVVILPDTSIKLPYALVNVSVGNIRSRPRHSDELVTQVLLGTPLSIIQKEEGWYRVQTPEGYLGWIDDEAIRLMSEDEWERWKQSDRVVYTESFGWIYTRPEEESRRVSDVTAGAFLEKLGESEAWFEVRIPDGRKGYIRKKHALIPGDWPAADSLSGAVVVETAMEYMGVPYLWGGTSPKGFDCSGYTKTVYAQHGILLPRDASQQVHVGIELPLDSSLQNYQPGDLLFFGRVEDNKDSLSFEERMQISLEDMRITHVAIYAGSGKIIHASGRVRLQSLDPEDPDFAGDRYDTFLQARRIVGAGREEGVLRLEDFIL